jgi:hypothetical protein
MMRSAFHILLGLLLWVVFGYYWHLVMRHPVTHETIHALLIVGGIIATITVFDLAWIFHNVRIAGRNKRKGRRAEPPSPTSDFLGRTFIAQSEDVIRRARYIEVHVIEIVDAGREGAGHKLFRVSDELPRTGA